MIITDVTAISKSKSKVYIDHEFAFVLYKGELHTYRIKAGEEIGEEVYRHILQEVLLKRAKFRCMNLLKSRDYTGYQLRNKLVQGMYPEEIIEEALRYVASYGYVNDLRYAVSYIQYASASKSKKKIQMDLIGKGISKADIAEAFEKLQEENEIEAEEELIQRLLVKKHYNEENATMEERRKMVGFLYRKGFPLDKIYKVLGQID